MNAWQRGLLLGLAIVPAGLAAQPALAPLLAPPAALPAVQVVHRAPLVLDTQRSQLGFEVRSRLGQRIEGSFPHFEGRIEVLSDGRHQVHLKMYTRSVEIPGKPRYTGWMRGEEFFDAARHPVVEFDSLPYDPARVDQGGDIHGRLMLRGVSHPETLRVEKAECARPGYDCDVVSRGTVLRGRYGMDNWQLALSDRVTFVLRARLSEAPKP
ncbi:polyisoprenoid-binding protein YceI [Stenotrophomonas maltophilia]|uniref:YceI family protein n=1 Tax=Stenotrophomonas chelatiphaga TaxID=517011 RepID=UPI000F4AFEC1|nr:YceI family protein [Stenotrophomonas chelatiphaga]MCS4231866.1 polyisoprenoid-binding protein YceI [Stenotrophomonas chelatiphaga]ROQ41809.1 polyisoprenoid-binding protein YceI [Stenotrophomonas maltophilia]